MEIGNNITYRQRIPNLTFTAIKFREAENTLRKELSSEELKKFNNLVERNKKYTNADLVL